MLNFLLQLPPNLIVSLVGLLATAALALTGAVLNEVRKRTKNAYVAEFLDRVAAIVWSVVGATEQQLVSELKSASSDGRLSAEEAAAAAQRALDLAKSELGARGMRELKKLTGDGEQYIRTRIEATVAERKAAFGASGGAS